MNNFEDIVGTVLSWKHINVICGKTEVYYNGFTPLKYVYKSCGLNLDCPLYKLCKSKLESNEKGQDHERRS